MEQIRLSSIKHPHPYGPQWLEDGSKIVVHHQFLVKFSVGNYVDERICDVVPINACYILVGRLWQTIEIQNTGKKRLLTPSRFVSFESSQTYFGNGCK